MFKINILITAVLLLLAGCASIGQKFSAGEPKNSLPFMARDIAEEMQSIAVPPFSGDEHAWHEAAQAVLSQSPRVSVISQKKLDSAIRAAKKDPALLLPEERIEYVSRLGRSAQAEAVLNGIILSREKRHELILQLVSSKDSRVFWVQAVDFSFKDNQISKSDQKELLDKMLSSVIPLLGKKNKPGLPPQPKHEMQHKIEPEQKPEAEQQSDPQPKADKKTKPSRKPGQAAEDVSPM